MTLFESMPQVAILGPRGIGQVHARLFQKAGANICAILGSTMQTAQQAGNLLHQSMGISPKPFDNLETLIRETQPMPYLYALHQNVISNRFSQPLIKGCLYFAKSHFFGNQI